MSKQCNNCGSYDMRKGWKCAYCDETYCGECDTCYECNEKQKELQQAIKDELRGIQFHHDRLQILLNKIIEYPEMLTQIKYHLE